MKQNEIDEKCTDNDNSGEETIDNCSQSSQEKQLNGIGDKFTVPGTSKYTVPGTPQNSRHYIFILFFILSMSLIVVAMEFMNLRKGRVLMYVFCCIFILHGYVFIRLIVRLLANKAIMQNHSMFHYFPIINSIWFYQAIPTIIESCKVVAKHKIEKSNFIPNEINRLISFIILECYTLPFIQLLAFVFSIIYGFTSIVNFEYVINAVLILYSSLSLAIIYSMIYFANDQN